MAMRIELIDAASRRARARLEELVLSRDGETYASVSKLLKRNHAYVQQHITRGTPKFLSTEDATAVARYFGIPARDLLPPLPAAGERPQGGTLPVATCANGTANGPPLTGYIEVPMDFLFLGEGVETEALCALRVMGDSMIPTLLPGDYVIFERRAVWAAEDRGSGLTDALFVLVIGGQWQVRRVQCDPRSGAITIRADNAAYPPWHDADLAQVHVGGRVIWAGKRL
ncbi:S24 family peptidase [Rhodothalassium salexigens]|nr:S24 family peptidase [Rhodothalassium salexigens]MBB4210522.1 hypothetical protein [Rhodothalassium salexigens DSM 2132]MBK1638067.1 hypothetical protein [Rhodothalassium salexigens DSM 2132]